MTGYAYQWVSRLANPILGWITGWISFTFLAIVAVAVDYTVAATVVPALFDFTGTALTSFLITAAILLLQGLLVAVSTKWTERVNNFAVSAELIGMVALVVLLFIVGVITHKLSAGNLFSRGDIPAEGYWNFGTRPRPGPGCSASCSARSPSWGSNPPPTWPKRPSDRKSLCHGQCGRPCWPRECSASCSCWW